MTLNITPLSNPDDIRREAGIAPPDVAENPAVDVNDADPRPATPGNQPTEPGVNLASNQPAAPLVDSNKAQEPTPAVVPEPPGPSSDYPSPSQSIVNPSIYPDPAQNEAVKVQNADGQNVFNESKAKAKYSYNIPMGVGIIASFLLVVAASYVYILLNPLRQLLAPTMDFDLRTLLLVAALLFAGVGLIKANIVAYWLTIVGSGFFAAYVSYQLIKMLLSTSMINTNSVNTMLVPGARSLVLYTVVSSLIVIAVFVWTTIYLLRPKVAAAFRS